MGFFSAGGTTQVNDSYSGLRGTSQFNPFMNNLVGNYNTGLNTAQQRVGDMNPLGLSANGLTASQNNAFSTLGKQMFGDVSSNYAGRGFLSPDNISGVIGSSLQQIAPQLMGQIYQNQIGNQQIMNDRFSTLNNMLNAGSGMLGTENHSVYKNTPQGMGFGFGKNFFDTFGNSLGETAGKAVSSVASSGMGGMGFAM